MLVVILVDNAVVFHEESTSPLVSLPISFNFPKPPSPKTLITKFYPENTDVEHSETVLKKVHINYL